MKTGTPEGVPAHDDHTDASFRRALPKTVNAAGIAISSSADASGKVGNVVRERPILFSGPMVRALLAGAKTQTRRVVMPQPDDGLIFGGFISYSTHKPDEGKASWYDALPLFTKSFRARCPYGEPGDRLWVREEHHITVRDPRAVSVRYHADDTTSPEVTIGAREYGLFLGRKKPEAVTRARFMWRCLSRITLEIVAVRVERLHAITEADACWEGIEIPDDHDYIGAYRNLWESINGAGSWALNPWVWVVEFKRIEGGA